MKEILILIHNMDIGGAQKSLISFLQCMSLASFGEEYHISLMPIDPIGPFMNQIPENVEVLQPPRELRWLGTRFNKRLLIKHFSISALLGEISWCVRKKMQCFPPALNLQQQLWASWRRFVPKYNKHYDVVISYMDGVPNYYVVDKVCAEKKVLWVHNEYQKQQYSSLFDAPYFEQCQAIVTISDSCRNCLLKAFEQYAHKIWVLENISSADNIIAKSREPIYTEFQRDNSWKLLTVGRLHFQKGIDIAIDACKILTDMGLRYQWLIVGEGIEHRRLQKQIDESDLSKYIRLLGARDNPYVYIKECDILVQPSRFEGKSIVLDEAKILCKPIIATNYTTVGDSIHHGNTGWIVEMTPEAVAEGIMRMCRDTELREKLQSQLHSQSGGNEAEIKKYIDIML